MCCATTTLFSSDKKDKKGSSFQESVFRSTCFLNDLIYFFFFFKKRHFSTCIFFFRWDFKSYRSSRVMCSAASTIRKESVRCFYFWQQACISMETRFWVRAGRGRRGRFDDKSWRWRRTEILSGEAAWNTLHTERRRDYSYCTHCCLSLHCGLKRIWLWHSFISKCPRTAEEEKKIYLQCRGAQKRTRLA